MYEEYLYDKERKVLELKLKIGKKNQKNEIVDGIFKGIDEYFDDYEEIPKLLIAYVKPKDDFDEDDSLYEIISDQDDWLADKIRKYKRHYDLDLKSKIHLEESLANHYSGRVKRHKLIVAGSFIVAGAIGIYTGFDFNTLQDAILTIVAGGAVVNALYQIVYNDPYFDSYLAQSAEKEKERLEKKKELIDKFFDEAEFVVLPYE